jgi:sulfur dioxygenase
VAKQAALGALYAETLASEATQQHAAATAESLGRPSLLHDDAMLGAWIKGAIGARVAADRIHRAHAHQAGGAVPPAPLIFRQLFDKESSTYTYLLADAATREALLVDPVLGLGPRDAGLVRDLGLSLRVAVNTHMHADHVTGTGWLRAGPVPALRTGMAAAYNDGSAVPMRTDLLLRDGDVLTFGTRYVTVRATPGHTVGCVSFVADDRSLVMTGDALFVRGCGRTDFQGGSAATLYRSVHTRLFSLPDRTAVYPAHDYEGRTVSSVWEERRYNPRLTRTPAAFVEIMAKLNLPRPAKMDMAVPRNRRCGAEDDPPTAPPA